MEEFLIYTGKVRKIYKLGDHHLLMRATDRVSSFDKHIGTINGKGELLNKMSAFWFNKTKHIIDNHLISTEKNMALVHKCTPFTIEVVVRGYITGNTQTSLWTHYNSGERVYCGIQFPDGLKKHQKLETPVITPTTKGNVDIPISKDNIITERYMTEDECNYVFDKAMELFNYGQALADKAGLILVDTKYEFGKNMNGDIMLIDELHTCDSSRYWLKSTYDGRFNAGLEPQKLDKDCVRDWVGITVGNPYIDPIPDIPDDIIERAYNCYKQFYDMISSVEEKVTLQTLSESSLSSTDSIQSLGFTRLDFLVVILSGSSKDDNHVNEIKNALSDKKIAYISYISSAHKNTREVLDIIKTYDNPDISDKDTNSSTEQTYKKIIWVTVAGRSNALSGVVAANSKYPVIACPPFTDKTDMMINIHSTLQCPNEVPVMTILEPGNVAIAIERILNL